MLPCHHLNSTSLKSPISTTPHKFYSLVASFDVSIICSYSLPLTYLSVLRFLLLQIQLVMFSVLFVVMGLFTGALLLELSRTFPI